MRVYVQAASKAEINRRLASGEDYLATQYTISGPVMCFLRQLKAGDTIARFLKLDGHGNPIAVAFHEWDAKKQKLR